MIWFFIKSHKSDITSLNFFIRKFLGSKTFVYTCVYIAYDVQKTDSIIHKTIYIGLKVHIFYFFIDMNESF